MTGLDVFAAQKRGGLPTGQVQRQTLDEALQLRLGGSGLDLANHGAKRIDDHDAGLRGFDLLDDGVQDRGQVLVEDDLGSG